MQSCRRGNIVELLSLFLGHLAPEPNKNRTYIALLCTTCMEKLLYFIMQLQWLQKYVVVLWQKHNQVEFHERILHLIFIEAGCDLLLLQRYQSITFLVACDLENDDFGKVAVGCRNNVLQCLLNVTTESKTCNF